MTKHHPHDERHMRHALMLAERALGRVAPNPAVGCVIVSAQGRVIARAHTQDGGRPHAETVALAAAGAGAHGATVYVSFEPCAHHGKTPPCADALIEAEPARVVVATQDPDPRVHGRGIERLRAAGIEVTAGVLEREAAHLNEGFIRRVTQNRPLVTLKIAQSLDGRIASASGESKWITGEESRRHVHLMRARHDAILIGIGTALADDPQLTCRIAGLEKYSPVRVVLDGKLKLGEWSKLAQTAREVPTVVYTVSEGGGPLRVCGVDVVRVAKDARGRPDIEAVLHDLAARGITRLLVEGGPTVHATFLNRGFADRLEIFRAPMLLGSAGKPAVEGLAALELGEAPRFRPLERRSLGNDLLESFAAGA